MRSGHSLAFSQFEDVRSSVLIEAVSLHDPVVLQVIAKSPTNSTAAICPFKISWNAESDWEPEEINSVSEGSCILVPIPSDSRTGVILRSVGYAESTQAISDYSFLEDETFVLRTQYDQSIAEERIWFVSDNVRCRSSVLRTSGGSGVLQTSFASEVRRLILSD